MPITNILFFIMNNKPHIVSTIIIMDFKNINYLIFPLQIEEENGIGLYK